MTTDIEKMISDPTKTIIILAFEEQTYSVAVDRTKVAGILADTDENAKRNNHTQATAWDWVIATLKGDKPHAEFAILMYTLLWLASRREGEGGRTEQLMKQGGNTLCYWITKEDDGWECASAIYPSNQNPTSGASILPKSSSLPFDTLRPGLPGLPGGPSLH